MQHDAAGNRVQRAEQQDERRVLTHLVKKGKEDGLKIGEGSLYPALQRILVNGWVAAEWGVSETNRKVRIYKLTPAGKKRLANERRTFDAMILAIGKVMEA